LENRKLRKLSSFFIKLFLTLNYFLQTCALNRKYRHKQIEIALSSKTVLIKLVRLQLIQHQSF
jgi:hypothetical protein